MPNNGEVKTPKYSLTEDNLFDLIQKYNKVLSNDTLSISETSTAWAGLVTLALSMGNVLSEVNGTITVASETTAITLAMLKHNIQCERDLYQKLYNTVTHNKYKSVTVSQKFTYKRTKMWGDYFEAWYSDSPRLVKYNK